MPYQHFFRCSVCQCHETTIEQFGEGTAEFCLECGMPLDSFEEVTRDSLFGPSRPVTQEERQQREYRQWLKYKEDVIWYALSFVPQHKKCGWCNEQFLAAPDGEGGHEPYCSPDCEEVSNGVDAYECYLLTQNEQRYMVYREHPTEL